jgi:hypothetical protein
MEETTKLSGKYWVEVSGWGLDASFFVEKTDLYWDPNGDKKMSLHHAVPEGTIIFVRLLSHDAPSDALPVAYRVAEIHAMDCNGLCETILLQLHPREKVPLRQELASYALEDSRSNKRCEPEEDSAQRETEEILQ